MEKKKDYSLRSSQDESTSESIETTTTTQHECVEEDIPSSGSVLLSAGVTKDGKEDGAKDGKKDLKEVVDVAGTKDGAEDGEENVADETTPNNSKVGRGERIASVTCSPICVPTVANVAEQEVASPTASNTAGQNPTSQDLRTKEIEGTEEVWYDSFTEFSTGFSFEAGENVSVREVHINDETTSSTDIGTRTELETSTVLQSSTEGLQPNMNVNSRRKNEDEEKRRLEKVREDDKEEDDEIMKRMLKLSPVYSTGYTVTGLGNTKNMCYLNSVIQCLANIPKLSEKLIHVTSSESNKSTNKPLKGKLTEEVGFVMKALRSGQFKSILLTSLKETVEQKFPRFANNDQQDAHELLMALIEKLHEELLERETNTSPISELFHGKVENRLECITCRRRTVAMEEFNCVYVDIPTKNL